MRRQGGHLKRRAVASEVDDVRELKFGVLFVCVNLSERQLLEVRQARTAERVGG